MGKKFIHEMRDKADDYYNNHEHHVNSLCAKVVSSIQPPIEDLSSPGKMEGRTLALVFT